MNYAVDINKLVANKATDHHVVSGNPINTGDGAIAVKFLRSDVEEEDKDKETAYKTFLFYKNPYAVGGKFNWTRKGDDASLPKLLQLKTNGTYGSIDWSPMGHGMTADGQVYYIMSEGPVQLDICCVKPYAQIGEPVYKYPEESLCYEWWDEDSEETTFLDENRIEHCEDIFTKTGESKIINGRVYQVFRNEYNEDIIWDGSPGFDGIFYVIGSTQEPIQSSEIITDIKWDKEASFSVFTAEDEEIEVDVTKPEINGDIDAFGIVDDPSNVVYAYLEPKKKFIELVENNLHQKVYVELPTEEVEHLYEVTIEELLNLRNTSKLKPGASYRITNYEFIPPEGCESANHRFDIIVPADDEKTLNENARAIQHEGDTYFADCDLAAWKLKFSPDNHQDMVITNDAAYYRRDKSKDIDDSEYPYAFAPCMWSEPYEFIEDDDDIVYVASPTPNVGDTTYHPNHEGGIYREVASIERDGKDGLGVIYYMKDEFNNEAPYDFKNLLTKIDIDQDYDYKLDEATFIPNPIGTYFTVFTFTNNTLEGYDGIDASLTGLVKNCIIKGTGFNHNVIMGPAENNIIEEGCKYCGISGRNNKIGQGCEKILISDLSEDNLIGNGCYGVELRGECKGNTIGDRVGIEYWRELFD